MRGKPAAKPQRRQPPPSSQPPAPPEVVSAGWLARAFLVTVVVALLCGYLTFCLLFARGQWQLVLHPVRTTALPDLVDGTYPQPLRFGTDESGQPQLSGIWMAADATGRYRHLTVLYLPSGDGSLQAATATLSGLRELGLNVFAFDYRGYGSSAPGHPSQTRMEADAARALTYVLTTRQTPENRVVLYGSGVGGFLAARLALQHPAIPALVVDAPRLHIEEDVRHDPRLRLLPVRLIFHEGFPLEPLLETLTTPKLILSRSATEPPELQRAADPKMTVALPEGSAGELFSRSLGRFLDLYAPPTPLPILVPQKTP